MRISFYFLLLFQATVLIGQGNSSLNINQSSGMPSNTVYDLHFDSLGYLWLATDNGISRFNGYECENFSTEDGLPTNEVWLFHEDVHHRIWLLNSVRTGVYLKNGKIEQWKTFDEGALTPSAYMYHTKGIAHRNRDKVFRILVDNQMTTLRYNEKSDSAEFAKHKTLFRTAMITTPLVRLENFVTTSLSDSSSFDEILLNLYKEVHPRHHLFNNEHLIKVDIDSLNFTHLQDGQEDLHFSGNIATVVHSPEINDSILHLDHSKGYLEYNYRKRKITDRFMTSVSTSLNRSIRKNHMVLSGSNEGVRVQHRFLNIMDDLPESTDNFCVTKDFMLAATHDQKLFIRRYKENKFHQEEGHQSTNLKLRRRGDTCFVFRGNRLDTYSKNNHRTSYFNKSHLKDIEGHDTETYTIMTLFHNIMGFFSSRDLLVKSSRYSVFFLDKLDSQTSISSRKIQQVNEICRLRDTFFFARTNGLFKINHQKDSLRSIPFFSGMDVVSLQSIDSSLLVITKSNGIFEIGEEIRLISNDTKGKIISCVLHNNELFYYTDTHVGRTNIETGQSEHYRLGVYFPFSSISKMDVVDDRLYLLDNFSNLATIPLEHLSVPDDDLTLQTRIPDSLTREKKPGFAKLVSNNFKVNLELIDVLSFGNITYQYRLLPGDSTWISTKNRDIPFTNMRSGTYTLEARAINAFDNTSPVNKTVIIVPTPWFQTIWFFLLVIASAVSLALILYRMQIQASRTKEEKQQQLDRRLASLEMDALRAQMNPHFIFNSLAAIQGFIRQSKKEEADNYLAQFASLIRTFLNQSQSRTVRLDEEISLLSTYVDLENMRFEGAIDFQMIIDPEIDTYQSIPSLLLQPFVENAINHGLFHKKGQKSLTIRMDQEQDAICIHIVDNGIGRKAAGIINSKTRPDHRSKGMSLIRERVETVNATGQFFISYSIEDLDHEQESGTLIKLRILPLYD